MNSLLGELYLDQSVDPSSFLSSLMSVEPLGAISDWDRGYKDLIIDFKNHTRVELLHLQQKEDFKGLQCTFSLCFGSLLVMGNTGGC